MTRQKQAGAEFPPRAPRAAPCLPQYLVADGALPRDGVGVVVGRNKREALSDGALQGGRRRRRGLWGRGMQRSGLPSAQDQGSRLCCRNQGAKATSGTARRRPARSPPPLHLQRVRLRLLVRLPHQLHGAAQPLHVGHLARQRGGAAAARVAADAGKPCGPGALRQLLQTHQQVDARRTLMSGVVTGMQMTALQPCGERAGQRERQQPATAVNP